MRTWNVVLMILSLSGGCGRYGFESTDEDSAPSDPPAGASPADASPDGQAVIDDPPSSIQPWGTPTLIAELSDPYEFDDDPTLTADLSEIYFSSMRGGDVDLWRARLQSTGQWSTPEPVAELNTSSVDDTPEISADGLTLYFSSDRPHPDNSTGCRDTYRSTRPNRNASWRTPVRIADLSSDGDDFSATPDAQSGLMVLASTRSDPDGGSFDLVMAVPASGGWATRVIADLDGRYADGSPTDERAPFLWRGGRELVFSSTRSGDRDLFMATRLSTSEEFGHRQPSAT